MSYDQTARRLAHARADYEGQLGQAKMIMAELRRTETEIADLSTRIEDLGKISGFLASYADERQSNIQTQIEGIVTRGLRSIFGEDLTLRLVNRQVGRRPELDFILTSTVNGAPLDTTIMDARGGGVAAVAGFLLRAVMILLTPGHRPVLFLDETFAQVSAEYEEPLADFIAELVTRTPLQIVLVTHSTAYNNAADRRYRLTQTEGRTSAQEVT